MATGNSSISSQLRYGGCVGDEGRLIRSPPGPRTLREREFMIQRSTLSMIRATGSSQTVNRQYIDNVKRATSNKKAMSESRGDWLPSRGVLTLHGTLDSQRTRTVLGRLAFRVCGPATWNKPLAEGVLVCMRCTPSFSSFL